MRKGKYVPKKDNVKGTSNDRGRTESTENCKGRKRFYVPFWQNKDCQNPRKLEHPGKHQFQKQINLRSAMEGGGGRGVTLRVK